MQQFSKPKFRVVIPARFASSRLLGKPLIDLAGKPMIVRVYESVHSALPEIDTVVAIDDSRIQIILDKYKIPFVFTSINHESGTDRVAEVARLCKWAEDEIIINVQGDEPLIPQELLQMFAQFCSTRKSISMATIAVPLDNSIQIADPNVVKITIDINNNAIAFSRAAFPFNRDLPIQKWPNKNYLRHVGIYAYKNSILQLLTSTPPCTLEQIEKLEQLRAQWLGIDINVMYWHSAPPQGVDTPEDALRVANFFKQNS